MAYDPEDAAALVRLVIAVAALLAAIQFMLVPTLTDAFRQRLFETRRDMFLLVADGRIEPTNLAYVMLRNTINGLLRQAERLSFSKVLVLGVMAQKIGADHRKALDAAIASVQDETARETLSNADKALSSAIVRFAIAKSPVAWALLLLLFLLVVGVLIRRAQLGAWRAARRLFKNELHKRLPTDGVQAELACLENGSDMLPAV